MNIQYLISVSPAMSVCFSFDGVRLKARSRLQRRWNGEDLVSIQFTLFSFIFRFALHFFLEKKNWIFFFGQISHSRLYLGSLKHDRSNRVDMAYHFGAWLHSPRAIKRELAGLRFYQARGEVKRKRKRGSGKVNWKVRLKHQRGLVLERQVTKRRRFSDISVECPIAVPSRNDG